MPLGSQTESPASSSNRGLVSRRGGRYGSPGRIKKEGGPVLEFKTYRSPPRKKKEVENDTIPSLCSTNSGLQSSSSSGSSTRASVVPKTKKEETEEGSEEVRPSSISCDVSHVDTTSPLASHDSAEGATLSKKQAQSSPKPHKTTEADSNGRRNVTFTPQRETSDVSEIETGLTGGCILLSSRYLMSAV